MQLKVTDYQSVTRWRWELQDDDGNFLGDHEVKLDTNAPEYAGYDDPRAYLSLYRDAHGGGRVGERELLRRLGDWMGEHVFGPLRDVFRAHMRQPATVIRVIVPPEAQKLLFHPFEQAHLETGGRPLVEDGIRFVYLSPDSPTKVAPKPTGKVLRFLAVFSIPTDADPLNLRHERYELRKMLLSLARTRGVAIEPRILQYGATRETLRDALEEADGWDVIHLSCHGGEGSLLLETDEGKTDIINAKGLHDLMLPAKDRLHLLTLSACWSGAATHDAARAMLGLDTKEPTRQEGTGPQTEFPSLGQALAQALDCAVVAMRYPVGDKFAADLARNLYGQMLSHRQPLPAALKLAMRDALSEEGARLAPSLSVATPILFGPRAADLTLTAPAQQPDFEIQRTSLFGFPDEPKHFVGRLLPMLRATQAFATKSDARGVLFYGMAGGGKTACAVELAHLYRPQGGQRRRFQGYCFHECPKEGSDIAGALVDCLTSIENQLRLKPTALTAVAGKPEDFSDRLLPRLTQMLSDHAILIVIDNIETLLTSSDEWRDGKWGEFIAALLAHRGDSRLVLTSRRVPADLVGQKALLREPIHALSFPETVLLAREMEYLGRYFESDEDHELLRAALRIIQGHPELLRQADRLAADRKRFAAHVARAAKAADGRDAPLAAFFETGETAQSEKNFVDTLSAWTAGITDQLAPAARLCFHCLCRMEEADRDSDIVGTIWRHVLTHAKDDVPEAAAALAESDGTLGESLDTLVACGLVGGRTIPLEDKTFTRYTVHPGVAEAGRAEANERFLAAVDVELGDYYSAAFQHGLETEMEGGGPLVVLAARRAVPHLLRAGLWTKAAVVVERVLHRDQTPTAINWAIPLLRRVADATRGANLQGHVASVLANVLLLAGRSDEAETILRELFAQGESRGDYRLASVASGYLISLLHDKGELNEAFTVAEHQIELSRKAGLGPWTQLGAECQRLQVLNASGRYADVLEAVEGHLEQLKTLPEQSEQDEVVVPWNIRELLLDTARHAAASMAQWETCLRLNAELVALHNQRGANAVDNAKARFNSYGPLIHLGRLAEAKGLLHACRDLFEQERDYEMLGKTYSALAQLEDEKAHHEAAASLARVALKYEYQSCQPAECAISHHNLSNYLERAGEPREQWLGHCLAAALIRIQTISGMFQPTLRNLALSDLPTTPPTFDEVANEVERIEGVRFRELFDRLPRTYADGDAALAAIWQMLPEARAALEKQEADFEQRRAKRQAVLAELPPAVRRAFDLDGQEFSAALKAALDTLPPEDREATLAKLVEAGLIRGGPNKDQILQEFDPLLRGIAAMARGEGNDEERADARGKLEQILNKLEENGWQISAPVQRIFAGERAPAALTAGLDEQDTALVQRILDLIAELPAA